MEGLKDKMLEATHLSLYNSFTSKAYRRDFKNTTVMVTRWKEYKERVSLYRLGPNAQRLDRTMKLVLPGPWTWPPREEKSKDKGARCPTDLMVCYPGPVAVTWRHYPRKTVGTNFSLLH